MAGSQVQMPTRACATTLIKHDNALGAESLCILCDLGELWLTLIGLLDHKTSHLLYRQPDETRGLWFIGDKDWKEQKNVKNCKEVEL